MSLLEIRNLGVRFGGLRALEDFNLDLDEGQLIALIGPNGAGKTTAFNLVTGVHPPTSGQVRLGGRVLSGRKAHQVSRMGVARTFQNIRLFARLSVLDNVRIGFHGDVTHGFWRTLLRSRRYRRQEASHTEQAMELLDIFSLAGHAGDEAASLPYGFQRRLEIARALATTPRVLLLDEPAAGMNPQEKLELMDLIGLIRRRYRLGIWLIEHDMKLVMSISDRVTVLDYGQTIASASPAEVQADPRVIQAYLGESEP